MKKPLILSLIVIPILLTALFYYFFREGTIVYKTLGIDSNLQHFFKSDLINSLPSLAHVYSFSLASWFVSDQKNGLLSCLLWVIINIVFELGQALPSDQLSSFPDFLAYFFRNGSFNWFDMIAIFVGGLTAYWTILKISGARTDEGNHSTN